MAQSTLLPSGTGLQNNWSTTGGSRPDIVNTIDDVTTYIHSPRNSATRDRITMTNLPSEAAFISQVDGIIRGRHTGTGTSTQIAVGFFESSTTKLATSHSSVLTTWTTYQDTVATSPTDAAWTPTLINGTRLLCDNDGSGSSGNQVDVTYFAAEVTYIPASGGMVFLLNSFVGTALGANILPQMYPGIMAYFKEKSRGLHVLTPEEWATTFRQLMEAKNVSYQF